MLLYLLRDFWVEHGDPRISHKPFWLVSNGMINITCIISAYLLLVTLILPRWMKNRKPMSLRMPMIIYSLTMALANLYFFLRCCQLTHGGRDLLNVVAPSPHDRSPEQLEIMEFNNIYGWSKIVDLIETIFFVLRKKDSQVTFLHIYHHSLVPVIAAISFILYPTSVPAGIFTFCNSFIHTLMYTYYFLAAIGPSMRPYLWWKAYITQLQIAQFIFFILCCAVYFSYSEGYSHAYMYIGVSQSPLFAFLFTRFYLRSYHAKSEASKKQI